MIKTYWIVASNEHAEQLFPGPTRWRLKAAIQEMLQGWGPVLVILTKGKYEVQKLENGPDVKWDPKPKGRQSKRAA